jgi:phage/plasmid-like protein (TIGR03299 family)
MTETTPARDRPWHPLGTYFPDGLYPAKVALDAAGLKDMIVAKKRSGWVDQDAEGNLILGGVSRDDKFQIVRMDTREALGQVGLVRDVLQNQTAFEWMEQLGWPFETMGSFRGGRRVFATMKMPGAMEVNTRAGIERVELFIHGINHHDGNGGLKLGVTPYRTLSQTTERVAVRGGKSPTTSWNVKSPLALADAEKAMVHRYAKVWAEEANALAATPITKDGATTVVADVLWEIFPERDTNGIRKENMLLARTKDIQERFTTEADRTGGATAYALRCALTSHLDHAGERRPRGDQKRLTPLALLGLAVLEGADDRKKDAAHRRVMKLVRR